jgi:DNA-binding CsgD family transcriptional regulator
MISFSDNNPSVHTRLSPRELEVLAMTSQGMTNSQVADRLSVTVHAVKFHLAAVYRKLGVRNRTEAAALYLGGLSNGLQPDAGKD